MTVESTERVAFCYSQSSLLDGWEWKVKKKEDDENSKNLILELPEIDCAEINISPVNLQDI